MNKLDYTNQLQHRKNIEDSLLAGGLAALENIKNTCKSLLLKPLPPPTVYYKHFNVYSFVNLNVSRSHTELVSTLDSLLSVCLDPNLPILLTSEANVMKMKLCKGATEILEFIGYNLDCDNEAYSITNPVYKTIINELSADICIATAEIEMLSSCTHPAPLRFTSSFFLALRDTVITSKNRPNIQSETTTGTYKPPHPRESMNSTICNSCGHKNRRFSAACEECRCALTTFTKPTISESTNKQIINEFISWQCSKCTLINKTVKDGTKICSICEHLESSENYIKSPLSEENSPIRLKDRKFSDTIKCPHCGCVNSKRGYACKSCRLPFDVRKPKVPDNITSVTILPNTKYIEWRCSHCTFDNKTPENNQQICEACRKSRRSESETPNTIERRSITTDNECSACFTEYNNMENKKIILPTCGHECCESCANVLTNCNICRTSLNNKSINSASDLMLDVKSLTEIHDENSDVNKHQTFQNIDFSQPYLLNTTCRGLAVITVFGSPNLNHTKLENDIVRLSKVLTRLKYECTVITDLSEFKIRQHSELQLHNANKGNIAEWKHALLFIRNIINNGNENYSSLLFFGIGENSTNPYSKGFEFVLSNNKGSLISQPTTLTSTFLESNLIIHNLREVLPHMPIYISFNFVENQSKISLVQNPKLLIEDTFICYYSQEYHKLSNSSLSLHAIIPFLCREIEEQHQNCANFSDIIFKASKSIHSEFSKFNKSAVNDFLLFHKNCLNYPVYLNENDDLLSIKLHSKSHFVSSELNYNARNGILIIFSNLLTYQDTLNFSLKAFKGKINLIKERFEQKRFTIIEKTLDHINSYKETLNSLHNSDKDYDCVVVLCISFSSSLHDVLLGNRDKISIDLITEDFSGLYPGVPKFLIFSLLLLEPLRNLGDNQSSQSPLVFNNCDLTSLNDIYISQCITCSSPKDYSANNISPIGGFVSLLSSKDKNKDIASLTQLNKKFFQRLEKNLIHFHEINSLRRDYSLIPKNNELSFLLENRSEELKLAYSKACIEGEEMFRFFRLMVIGPEGVGKTSLLNSLTGKPFNENEKSTPFVDKFDLSVESINQNWDCVQMNSYIDKLDETRKVMAASYIVSNTSLKNYKKDGQIEKEDENIYFPDIIINTPLDNRGNIPPKAPEIATTIKNTNNDNNNIDDYDNKNKNNDNNNINTDKSKNENSNNNTILLPKSHSYPPSIQIYGINDDRATSPIPNSSCFSPLISDTNDALVSDDEIQTLVPMDIISERLLYNDEDNTFNSPDMFTAWDFAGQVYLYCFHSLFLSPRAIYLLLIDLSVDSLEQNLIVRQERTDRRDLRCQAGVPTNYLQTIGFWMHAIYSVSRASLVSNLSKKTAKVLFVFSRADKISDPEEKAMKFTNEIKKHFENSETLSLLYEMDKPFIISCNPLSRYSQNLQLLKTTINDISEKVAFREEIPIKWLDFVSLLLKEEKSILNFKIIRELAKRTKCQESLDDLLKLFHDIGFFFLHDKIVIKDIQSVLNLLYHIITPSECNFSDKQDIAECENEGKMSLYLLDHIFVILELGIFKNDLITMMKKYGILISYTNQDDDEFYYVPYLLRGSLPDMHDNPQITDVFTYYIYFPDNFIPASVYFTLLSWTLHYHNQPKVQPDLGFDVASFQFKEGVKFTIDFVTSKSYIRLKFSKEKGCKEVIADSIISNLLLDIQVEIVRIQARLIPCGKAAKIVLHCECHTAEQVTTSGILPAPCVLLEDLRNILNSNKLVCKNGTVVIEQPFLNLDLGSNAVSCLSNHSDILNYIDNHYTEMISNIEWVKVAPHLFEFGLIGTDKMFSIFCQEFRQSLKTKELMAKIQDSGVYWASRLYLALQKDNASSINKTFSREILDYLTKINAGERYFVRSRPPYGIALFLNNHEFVSPDYPLRDGSKQDLNSLVQTFSNLQFEIDPHENKTADEFRYILSEIAKKDHSKYNSFFCVVMSHGNDDNIIFYDGEIMSKEEIVSYFQLSNCPSLCGKPKIFIFQACRGEAMEEKQGLKETSNSTEKVQTTSEISAQVLADMRKKNEVSNLKGSKIIYNRKSHQSNPNEAEPLMKENDTLVAESSDIYIGHGSQADHVSYRLSGFGSMYIQTFCEVINRRPDEEFTHIMTEVRRKVLDFCKKRTDFGHILLTEDNSFLKKKLYFNLEQ